MFVLETVKEKEKQYTLLWMDRTTAGRSCLIGITRADNIIIYQSYYILLLYDIILHRILPTQK